MNTDHLQTPFELDHELKAARVRMYKIAVGIGLLGAGPAIALKDIAPWFIAIPIAAGGIFGIILDLRESRKKASILRLTRNISILEFSSQSLARVSRKPFVSTTTPSVEAALIGREQFSSPSARGRQTPAIDNGRRLRQQDFPEAEPAKED